MQELMLCASGRDQAAVMFLTLVEQYRALPQSDCEELLSFAHYVWKRFLCLSSPHALTEDLSTEQLSRPLPEASQVHSSLFDDFVEPVLRGLDSRVLPLLLKPRKFGRSRANTPLKLIRPNIRLSRSSSSAAGNNEKKK